ncbi:unnamed protein product, partial [Schistosoma margrebowiei]|uniref:PSI domain-containing protein n=1 Tax=Schistosoma margrebowiei TaxID=48269 RepID=A0AA85AG04_9TREM
MYDQKKIGDINNYMTIARLLKTEISDQHCPKHNSNKACQEATTSNTTCIWCETANMCITSNDKDLHEFKVNGCKNKSSTVNVVTEPTTLETTETDLRTELKKTSPSTESHL